MTYPLDRPLPATAGQTWAVDPYAVPPGTDEDKCSRCTNDHHAACVDVPSTGRCCCGRYRTENE